MVGSRSNTLLLWVILGVCPAYAGEASQPLEMRAASPALRRLPATALRIADRRSSGRRSGQMTSAGLRVRQYLDEGFRQISRRAAPAARESFLAALREVAVARVNAKVAPSATQSLADSLLAMREMRDFYAPGSRVQLDPYVMAVAHQTPVLKGTVETGVASQQAIDRYSAYATGQLVAACGKEPLAAEALYGLGKIASRAALTQVADSRAAQLAKIFFSASLRVNPRHAVVGNELGVILARGGSWERALLVLRQSATYAPSQAIWHNLAVVHQYRGERELATLAQGEVWRLSRNAEVTPHPQQFSLLDAQRPGAVARAAAP